MPAVAEISAEESINALLEQGLEVPSDLLDEYAPRFAEHSFPFFCWYYMRQHLHEDLADYHLKVMSTLENMQPGRHVQLLLPREHGKSTLVSLCFIMWNICYRKKRHIFLVSSTAENAQKFLGKVNQELRSNELIRRDFGDLSGLDDIGRKQTWKQSKLKTANQVLLLAIGTNGSVRGANESLPENLAADFAGRDRFGHALYRKVSSFRPDLIVADDIIEDKWTKTKHVRDQTWNWFWRALYNALDKDQGNLVVVGTTLHDDDLVSRIFRDKVQTRGWTKTKLPACTGFDPITRNPLNCLWPAGWAAPDMNKPVNSEGELIPLDELHLWNHKDVFYLSKLYWKREEIGPRAFAQEFLLNPLEGGYRYFVRKDWRYFILQNSHVTAEGMAALERLGHEVEVLPSDLICVTCIDPAGTRQEQVRDGSDPDYTAIATLGYSPHNRRFYVVDIHRQRISALRQQELLIHHYRRYNGEFFTGDNDASFNFIHLGILVESVAYQKALATMLDEIAPALGTYPRVVEVKRGRRDKTTRALAVSPLSERRQLVWPEQFAVDLRRQDTEEAMDELDRFPEADHDDCVDCVVDGLHFLSKMSLSLNRGLNAINVMKAMVTAMPEMYAFVSKRDREGVDFQDAVQQWQSMQRV